MTAPLHAAPPRAAEGLLFPAPAAPEPAGLPRPAAAERQQALSALEQRYPGLWRAGQLGRAGGAAVCPTGYDALSAELPGGGWPAGGLTELLTTQGGAGEMRLLLPALRTLAGAGRRIALVAPPYLPNAMGLAAAGLPARQCYWVRAPAEAARAAQQADMLWAAEQVLRSQAFGGVLVWLPAARPEALRRLQVLAQAGDAVAWALRPATALRESSPAVLRLLLAPLPGNMLSITFHKRRGPVRDTPLLLRLDGMAAATRAAAWPVPAGAPAGPEPLAQSSQLSSDAVLDRGAPAAPAPGRPAAQLA
ncbi:translesion DNA synthesis-associated protein ImuA [Cupriavidus taiwanensis]|uniref:Required for the error-prone processing of DNA lesions along with dnaE2 and imuB n=1 Tax=Cupriavidus taiwanensis TaxID=164546 RepID=A0A7Z7NQD6_9BURK|nr:translesion DNA synthesis-associated protein ImuA [Cupriavidus taiwanensis]SOZ10234.1 required for the error-prone processing of DNA lesions along with dnaE2 and imuB [Cupriavidus taiwanensis]SOZ12404.1 required for the error-prone processing of DNA lesions along with dnaE2 and imuB [Cupriavidus taiwanensis]SOZ43709.1 required for the error-prone processing of DNA lesions along with dnaE2 and imuB [Cupriavidus taiwanensis]SPC22951.1 required for the error-prone processing of DNA lesions alon